MRILDGIAEGEPIPDTATRSSSPTSMSVRRAKAAAVEHWYRHRTAIENMFRDAKIGAALRPLPLGIPPGQHRLDEGALLAVNIAG